MKAPAIIVAAALVFGLSSAAQASPVTFSDFTFKGTCSDCTGFGTGALVLANYTLGNSFDTAANLVSFNYSSNLLSLSIFNPLFGPLPPGSQPIFQIMGSLPTLPVPGSLPGPAFVVIQGTMGATLLSEATGTGFWCAGNFCNGDTGPVSSWTETPLPAALPLFATGIGALGLLGWRRKRKAQAVA